MVCIAGIIFGMLSHRDARAANRRAEEAERRAEDQQRRAGKTDVYRQLHLLALYRFGERAYDVQQRYRLTGRDGTVIEPVTPEKPLSDRELHALDFDGPRVASPEVMAAITHAQEEHRAWQNAVREYEQAADRNRAAAQTGNPAGANSSQHMDDLINRRHKGAAAAGAADLALIELLRAETSPPG